MTLNFTQKISKNIIQPEKNVDFSAFVHEFPFERYIKYFSLFSVFFYNANLLTIIPFLKMLIVPPLSETTIPMAFVIRVIPAIEECRVPNPS